MLGVLGLYELQQALEREEQQFAAAQDDPASHANLSDSLQALWERAELARAEIANGHPALNSQALINMNSALDALIEEFVPAMRDILVRAVTDEAIRQAEENVPGAGEQLIHNPHAKTGVFGSAKPNRPPRIVPPIRFAQAQFDSIGQREQLAAQWIWPPRVPLRTCGPHPASADPVAAPRRRGTLNAWPR